MVLFSLIQPTNRSTFPYNLSFLFCCIPHNQHCDHPFPQNTYTIDSGFIHNQMYIPFQSRFFLMFNTSSRACILQQTNKHAYIEDCSFPYTFKRFYRGSIQLNEPAIRIALQTHAHATTDSSGGLIIAAGTREQPYTTGMETPILWFWE